MTDLLTPAEAIDVVLAGHFPRSQPDKRRGVAAEAARVAIAADRALRSTTPDARAICQALGFDPTNHHNALACPYCTGGDMVAVRVGGRIVGHVEKAAAAELMHSAAPHALYSIGGQGERS